MARCLQQEIEKLKGMILSLSVLVEESVNKASLSVLQLSEEIAQQVVANDDKIDAMEIEVEEECLKILALHQPVAADLRYIVAILKINDELERIGDLAVNIAERTMSLVDCQKYEMVFNFNLMTSMVTKMLKMSIDSLIHYNEDQAKKVFSLDDEIDEIHSKMYVKVQEVIAKNPESAHAALHYLSVSKHLERIADHAESVAENVLYMVNGEIVRHQHIELK